MNNQYLSIVGEFEYTKIIEKSKFICSIKGVENEDEAKEFVSLIKKKHSLATHNCYAYIADENGSIQKFSDDGEPQGTAGLPMIESLKSSGLFKVACVVTRYFGGIKLGTGGLARAYSGTVKECINECCVIKNFVLSTVMQVKISYDYYSKILKLFENENVVLVATDFGDFVNVEIACKNEYLSTFINKLNDALSGKFDYKVMEEKYYSFKV